MHVSKRRLRLLSLVYGIGVFIWLSVEDVSTGPVVFFGIGGAILIIALTIVGKLDRLRSTQRYLPLFTALLGGVGGGLASATTVGLMFFKNARHNHLFPDYTVAAMLAILQRAPTWVLAGSLIGLSAGLGWLARYGHRNHRYEHR